MTEGPIIENSPAPRTRQSLAQDLSSLGVTPGMVLLVHSSLSSLGWVCGGPVAVIQALMDAITPEGTLVMPAHSGDLSEPSYWEQPPVPRAWWPIIRESMPAFDLSTTPSRGMGRIAEVFRTWPGTLRSNHPADSFAARGPHAARIVADHSLDLSLGEASPLARIYDLDGWVLLLGVGHDSNTSFHLAELRAGVVSFLEQGAPMMESERRVWKVYRNADYSTDSFVELGEALAAEGLVLTGQVGSAAARLFPQRRAVDFAARWFKDRGPRKS